MYKKCKNGQREWKNSVNVSDEEIVEQVLAGEKETFRILIERYQKPVYNLMYRAVRSSDDAADLSQEVFLLAFDRLWRFNRDRPFFPWLYTIAVNHLRDWQRKNSLNRAKQYIIEQTEQERSALLPKQHEQFESREAADKVKSALLQLHEQTREILLARFEHGMKVREVAAAFGITESSVKMKVKRGLHELKNRLEEKQR